MVDERFYKSAEKELRKNGWKKPYMHKDWRKMTKYELKYLRVRNDIAYGMYCEFIGSDDRSHIDIKEMMPA